MAENQQGSGSSSGASNRGFASMDDEKQREIASKGGKSVPAEERSFAKDPQMAAEAGRKGGESSQGGGGQESGGRGGGDQGSGAQGSSASSGQRAGSGNFAQDREKASEAGRKGGQH